MKILAVFLLLSQFSTGFCCCLDMGCGQNGDRHALPQAAETPGQAEPSSCHGEPKAVKKASCHEDQTGPGTMEPYQGKEGLNKTCRCGNHGAPVAGKYVPTKVEGPSLTAPLTQFSQGFDRLYPPAKDHRECLAPAMGQLSCWEPDLAQLSRFII